MDQAFGSDNDVDAIKTDNNGWCCGPPPGSYFPKLEFG